MLTDKALRERKWGRYPSLDKLLGEQPVPSHYYGFSSVSDNVFGQLNRLAEVAVTIREHADSIRGAQITTARDVIKPPPKVPEVYHPCQSTNP